MCKTNNINSCTVYMDGFTRHRDMISTLFQEHFKHENTCHKGYKLKTVNILYFFKDFFKVCKKINLTEFPQR